MRVLLFAAVSAIALSGCIYIGGDDRYDGFDGGGGRSDSERLYAVSVETGGVRVRVASNGCTSEDTFDVDVDRYVVSGNERYLVRFEREAPDRCRAYMPDGVELFFSRDRLGLPPDAPISIANRIGR